MKILIEKIVDDVKKKKELTTIEEDFVARRVKNYLNSNAKIRDFLIEHDIKTVDRSGKYKQMIKDIRADLRKVYGVFSTKQAKAREEFLKAGDWDSILKSHLSTKERMGIYPKLYKKIWEITGEPKSIVDLACGLNPFSFGYMDLENIKYFASELSKEDTDFIQKYFDQEKRIDGKTKAIDLLKIKDDIDLFRLIEKSDVALLFKFLDPVLIKSRKIGEMLIKAIPASWVVVSFATRTIGQKEMKGAERGWIVKMSERLGYEVKVLKFENEIFYVIKKWK